MATDNEALDIIESKIRELELKVYGDNFESSNDVSTIIDFLLKANTLLATAVSGMERPPFKRLPELNDYLDINPVTEDPTGLVTKLNIILSMESDLRNSIEILDRVKEAKEILNDGSVKNAEALKEDLNNAIMNHVSIRDRLQEVSSGVERILTNFNEICLELSKSFFMLNEAVAKLESKSKS